MRAAQIDSYGDATVVRVTDQAARPRPAAWQVLVAVRAAALNPFDLKVLGGLVRQMAELKFPAVLGGDVAGTVAEIGPDVSGFEVGQAVYGQAGALSGHGSLAEFTPVKADQLTAKPSSVDFTAAAAMPLVGASAYQALVDHINLRAGQKILIHGGAGGIGSVAIQLAKHLGAHVATTVSSDDMDFVRTLGADDVIDYKTQKFADIIKNYDAVLDTVGGQANRQSYAVLKPGGSLVSMAAQADEDLVNRYDINYTAQFSRVTTERLNALAQLIDNGAIKPVVDRTFKLDQTAEALNYLAAGRPRGKVVIKIVG